MDEQELFYLMSRGLSRQQARRLVVQGFFRRVVDRMAWSGADQRLAAALQRRVEVDA